MLKIKNLSVVARAFGVKEEEEEEEKKITNHISNYFN